MSDMNVNPNLFNSYPKKWRSLIFFGTMGMDCEIKVASNRVETKLMINQLKRLLDESANFCIKKTLTEESR